MQSWSGNLKVCFKRILMKNFLIPVFTLLLILHGTELVSQTLFLNLDDGWHFRKVSDPVKWYEAKIPGSIYNDLYTNYLIPDPYLSDNEQKLQWIEKEAWEYIDTFILTEDQIQNNHIELVFEGLDTRCDVYVNDSFMSAHASMFYPLVLDVKKQLKTGKNTIRVYFYSQAGYAKELYKKNKVPLPDDERVMLRKAQYQWGWDWGPRFVGCGITGRVYLTSWNKFKIESVHFVQEMITEKQAKIRAEICISSDTDFVSAISISKYHFNIDDTSENFDNIFVPDSDYIRTQVRIIKGENTIKLNFSIKNPQLWWTYELGFPYLYKFGIFIFDDQSKLDYYTTEYIGLRKLELIRDKDSLGQSFFFKLNGVPLFIKGANYIPWEADIGRWRGNFDCGELSGCRKTDHKKYDLINQLKPLHINMIRVWGGGIYENDRFYYLCDELGILVWQDFMFACAMYPGDSAFLENVRKEAEYQVKRLRNHPCLALWCGNNEIDEGWKNWGWQEKYKYSTQDSTEIWHNYLKIFDTILPSAVRKFNPETPYIPTSPRIGWGHPESMKEGDSHYWGVWWGEQPFETYKQKVPRFMSEFGFQGMPDMKTFKSFTIDSDLYLGSPVLKAHQKHPRGYELIDKYMGWYYKKPKDFASYVYVSQLLQAYGMGMAIEAQRRAKPYCMGTLFWQLNDCWPVTSWSAIDHEGQKKAFAYNLNYLYSKHLVSADIENGKLKIFIISDSITRFKAILQLLLRNFEGDTLWSFKQEVLINPDSARLCFIMDTSELLSKFNRNRIFLEMGLWLNRKNIAPGFFYFVPPKELELEKPQISFKVGRIEDIGGTVLVLKTNKLAKNVYIWSDIQNIKFERNYFDLLPGRTARVRIRGFVDQDKFEKSIHIISLTDSF